VRRGLKEGRGQQEARGKNDGVSLPASRCSTAHQLGTSDEQDGRRDGLTDRRSPSEERLDVLESSHRFEGGSELERAHRGRGEERSEGEVAGRGDDGNVVL
jgi:hypothetical protein